MDRVTRAVQYNDDDITPQGLRWPDKRQVTCILNEDIS